MASSKLCLFSPKLQQSYCLFGDWLQLRGHLHLLLRFRQLENLKEAIYYLMSCWMSVRVMSVLARLEVKAFLWTLLILPWIVASLRLFTFLTHSFFSSRLKFFQRNWEGISSRLVIVCINALILVHLPRNHQDTMKLC